MTGSLVGASFGGIGDRNNWGNLVIVLDPAHLAGRDATARGVAGLAARLHALRRVWAWRAPSRPHVGAVGLTPCGRAASSLRAPRTFWQAPGVAELLVPGERGNRAAQKHRTTGAIVIEDRLWQHVRQAAGLASRAVRAQRAVKRTRA